MRSSVRFVAYGLAACALVGCDGGEDTDDTDLPVDTEAVAVLHHRDEAQAVAEQLNLRVPQAPAEGDDLRRCARPTARVGRSGMSVAVRCQGGGQGAVVAGGAGLDDGLLGE